QRRRGLNHDPSHVLGTVAGLTPSPTSTRSCPVAGGTPRGSPRRDEYCRSSLPGPSLFAFSSNRRSQVEMTLRCPFEAKETVMAIVITINGNNSGEGFLIAPVGGATFPAPLGLRTDDGSSVAA